RGAHRAHDGRERPVLRGVLDRPDDVRRVVARPAARCAGRRSDAVDGRRPRCWNSRRRRVADCDDLRAEPDRHFPLACRIRGPHGLSRWNRGALRRLGEARWMTWYSANHAFLPGGVAPCVRIQGVDGHIAAIERGAAQPDDVRLPGLVMPGFANTHSHAFHRALRGRTHESPEGAPGTFWTWRGRMYDLASRLDPDNYFALARATYAEMALAGVTSVGEFHYLHHAPGGRPYA